MSVQSSLRIDGVTEIFPGMTAVPGGGKTFLVHYLGASGLSDLPAGFAGNPDGFFQSVNAALLACRAGRGDKIICLPGHVESVSTANYWSGITATCTDVEIVGVGTGTNRPTFTWTAAAATILFSQPNIKLRNCRLFLAGPHVAGSALTVAAPITVSVSGCEITDCEIAYGFASTQIVAIGITVTTGADRFNFSRNDCYAETVAVPTTTFLRLTAANWLTMDDTSIIGPGSTTTIGPVQELTTASLKKRIRRCVIKNTVASSTVAYTAIAGTGHLDSCDFAVGTGTLAITASSAVTAGNCYTFSVATGLQTLLAIT